MVEIATKTLAEIYLQQGDLEKAYEIYKTLATQNPSDSQIQNRLKELNQKRSSLHRAEAPLFHTKEERIRLLEQWLANIRKRKIK